MDAADTQQDHERAARLLTGLPLPGLNGIALNTLPSFPALAPTAAPTGVDQLLQEYQGQVRALLHPADAEEHEYAARHAASLNELLKSALHKRPDIANLCVSLCCEAFSSSSVWCKAISKLPVSRMLIDQ